MSLPVNESLGSLTTTYAQRALQYFKTFSDADAILANLMVPGLYASVHNMVAHDYKKFLPLYGHADLLDEGNWLAAMHHELTSQGKVWRDSSEMEEQMKLLSDHIAKAGQRIPLYRRHIREKLAATYMTWHNSITAQRLEKLMGKPPRVMHHVYRTRETASLEEAMQYLCANEDIRAGHSSPGRSAPAP
jgi:ribosomal protein S24E